MQRTWPADWEVRKRGDSCPFCGDISSHSFRKGRVSEALLEPRGIARGHVAVAYRGRHVADLTALTATELADYWRDVQDVSRMIERVFEPCHVNYLLLGNRVPHLHVHIVPRYLDDPSPEQPLAWNPREVPAAEYSTQLRQLHAAGDALTR